MTFQNFLTCSALEIAHFVQTSAADPILTVQAVFQLIGCRFNFVLTACTLHLCTALKYSKTIVNLQHKFSITTISQNVLVSF